jgi:hypothetical protein
MPIEPFTSRISYVSGDLVKGRRIKLAFHWTCIIQHRLRRFEIGNHLCRFGEKSPLLIKGGAPIHQKMVELWVNSWMGAFYAHSVKSHPYAHSVKRLFDEKTLRWKGTPPSLSTRGGDWIRNLNLWMLKRLANLTEDSLMEHTAHRYLREVDYSRH